MPGHTDEEKKKKKQLRNLMVKEISLVGDPANDGARVVLTKVNDDFSDQGNASDKKFIDDLIKGDDQMAKEDDKKKIEDDKKKKDDVVLSKKEYDSIMKTVSDYNESQKLDEVIKSLEGREKEYFDGLKDDAKTEFVGKTKDEQKAEITKAFDKEDLEKAAGEKAASAIAKANKVAEDALKEAKIATEKLSSIEFGKKADELIPNISGTIEERGKLLKALDSLEGKDKEILNKALEDANKHIGKAMDELGTSELGEDNPVRKLEVMAKEFHKESKDKDMTYEKAFVAVMETPEGAELYRQSN